MSGGVTIPVLRDGPADAKATLVLAPGSSEPMDSPLLTQFATGVAAAGIAVVRFEFSHLRERRTRGTRRPPPRMPTLLTEYRTLLGELAGRNALVIGGRSLGARVASHLVNEVGAVALIALSYPFHPPRRADVTRTAHLHELERPALIVQGERDPFGTPVDVGTYGLPATISVHWIPDGDHALRPRRSGARSWDDNLADACDTAVRFVRAVADVP